MSVEDALFSVLIAVFARRNFKLNHTFSIHISSEHDENDTTHNIQSW